VNNDKWRLFIGDQEIVEVTSVQLPSVTQCVDRLSQRVQQAITIKMEDTADIYVYASFIKDMVTRWVRQIKQPDEVSLDFNLIPIGDNQLQVVFGNLYTALSFIGVLLADKSVTAYTDQNGCRFTLSEDGQLLVRPKSPLERIRVATNITRRVDRPEDWVVHPAEEVEYNG
jgi:hypothetical protein